MQATEAAFSEAGGLIEGDDVRIAGVKVGKVEAVDLAGDHVRVDFRITEDVAFGPQTAASVRMNPARAEVPRSRAQGQRADEGGREIPLERTISSYDIVNAFNDLTQTAERIDTDQLATSLNVMASEFKDSSPREGGPERPDPAVAHDRLP